MVRRDRSEVGLGATLTFHNTSQTEQRSVNRLSELAQTLKQRRGRHEQRLGGASPDFISRSRSRLSSRRSRIFSVVSMCRGFTTPASCGACGKDTRRLSTDQVDLRTSFSDQHSYPATAAWHVTGAPVGRGKLYVIADSHIEKSVCSLLYA